MAIMEYLEETRPDPPLLPKDPATRAKVGKTNNFSAVLDPPAITVLGKCSLLDPTVRSCILCIVFACNTGFIQSMITQEQLRDQGVGGTDTLSQLDQKASKVLAP